MPGFDDIRLAWNGRTYVIPANRVMGALARVEDSITFGELHAHTQRNSVPVAKLSQAFGSVLRYAGANVEDDEIYAGMFQEAGRETVMAAFRVLMEMMLPASARKSAAPADAGQEVPPANPPAATGS